MGSREGRPVYPSLRGFRVVAYHVPSVFQPPSGRTAGFVKVDERALALVNQLDALLRPSIPGREELQLFLDSEFQLNLLDDRVASAIGRSSAFPLFAPLRRDLEQEGARLRSETLRRLEPAPRLLLQAVLPALTRSLTELGVPLSRPTDVRSWAEVPGRAPELSVVQSLLNEAAGGGFAASRS